MKSQDYVVELTVNNSFVFEKAFSLTDVESKPSHLCNEFTIYLWVFYDLHVWEELLTSSRERSIVYFHVKKKEERRKKKEERRRKKKKKLEVNDCYEIFAVNMFIEFWMTFIPLHIAMSTF